MRRKQWRFVKAIVHDCNKAKCWSVNVRHEHTGIMILKLISEIEFLHWKKASSY